jgi:hypothetical protein
LKKPNKYILNVQQLYVTDVPLRENQNLTDNIGQLATYMLTQLALLKKYHTPTNATVNGPDTASGNNLL